MKVVYNLCFGGFSLSEVATKRYLELKGLPYTTETSKFEMLHYKVDGKHWSNRDIPRNDLILAQVVEELGPKANGAFAQLAIADVPTGQRWRIDEYDGSESVMTVDDYEWQIAT